MTFQTLLAGAALVFLYVVKRLADEPLSRLSERFADWLLPSDRPSTYRLARGITWLCLTVSPAESAAHHAAESLRDDLDELSTTGAEGVHPALMAVSLCAPSIVARGRVLAPEFLVGIPLLLAIPGGLPTVGLLFLLDHLACRMPVRLSQTREWLTGVVIGLTFVPMVGAIGACVAGLNLAVGLGIGAYCFVCAVLAVLVTLFSDGRSIPMFNRGTPSETDAARTLEPQER